MNYHKTNIFYQILSTTETKVFTHVLSQQISRCSPRWRQRCCLSFPSRSATWPWIHKRKSRLRTKQEKPTNKNVGHFRSNSEMLFVALYLIIEVWNNTQVKNRILFSIFFTYIQYCLGGKPALSQQSPPGWPYIFTYIFGESLGSPIPRFHTDPRDAARGFGNHVCIQGISVKIKKPMKGPSDSYRG